MKLGVQAPYIEHEPTGSWLWDWIGRFFIRPLTTVIDGAGLGYGDGTNLDNMAGVWIQYTSNATPNTEDLITHNLGLIPVGFIVMKVNKPGHVYQSTTPWSTTQMSLKSDQASMTALLFVLPPSNQGTI